jgi:hypothetical protein
MTNRIFLNIAMLSKFILIIVTGMILFHYNMKIEILSKEIAYIDEILESDKSKLRVFKAKYAWLSSPEMIAKLTSEYLDDSHRASYGFEVARTYSFANFSSKIKPRYVTQLDIENVTK